MKKRVVSMLLVLCMVLAMLPVTVLADDTFSGSTYESEAVDYNNAAGDYTVCGTGLSAPNVTVTNVASTGKIKLTWDAVDGASAYKVYRASSKNDTYKLMMTTEKTSYTNTSVNTFETYFYYVVAVAKDGSLSSPSATVSGICKLPCPEVTASNVASTGKIKLTWEPIDNAVKYEVYRATSQSGKYTLIYTTKNTSYTNTSAVAAKRYYYKVVAVASDTKANSAASSVVSRLCDLASPTLTMSNVASTGKIKLSWNVIDGAAGYKIYRSTDSKNWKLITTINDPQKTTLTNTSTNAGEKYYYRIKAIALDSNADSAYSSVKSRTCDLPRTVVSAGLNSKGQPVLTWDEVNGAVEYKVYRATSEDGEYKLIKTTDKTSFTNTSASAYETYYYKVVCVNKNTDANSAKSLAVGVSATSVNISTSKLSKDFVSRINEYREYFGINTLDWYEDGEIAARTRAAEYVISFGENRPDGRSIEEMMEAYGIAYEVGLRTDMPASDIVDVLMYYEEYEDFASILMYEDWEYAVVAYNNDYWCILFG